MYQSANPTALRSQNEITAALLALMREHPYSEISVKQITLECRLSRKTFYRNYDSKDDVLFSLIRSTLNNYYDTINAAESDPLSAVFAYVEQNRELLLLLDRNNMLHVVLQCLNDYDPMLRREMASASNPYNRLFEGLESGYIMALIIGAFWNVIALWIHGGMTEDPERIKKTILQYFQRIHSTF